MKNFGSNKDIDHTIMPPLYSPVSAKDYRWYNLALRTAALSNCRYQLGAAIIGKGGNVLSLGSNILKSHTDHKHWPSWVVSTHAEHVCIRHARHRDIDLRGTTMYIARLGGNEISKPCIMCAEYIYLAGIRTIVYNDGNNLRKVKVANLTF